MAGAGDHPEAQAAVDRHNPSWITSGQVLTPVGGGARVLDAVVDFTSGLSRWRTSFNLGLQDIELRYKRSLLGPFWISASLVATILALAFVFSGVFQQEFANYIAWLGAGLLAWQLITGLTQESAGSVVEHAGMLQNVRLPITLISGRIVIRTAIIFAHNAVAVLVTLMAFGHRFEPVALLAIPGAGAILLVGFFLCSAIGPICARFRDIPLVIQNLMQVIFFLTPIFWMPSTMSHRPAFISANPFYHMIELVRAPMLGNVPDPVNWKVTLWCGAGAVLLAIVSLTLTRRRINLWL